ncbi:ETS domain-containing protein Elk-1-like [Agelaius tricolor]|uniref:ETS domain-containing protein Elk-1-like n=1 Tax=Agelaius tricolor TaxID=9191 RepID=UPI0039F1FE78
MPAAGLTMRDAAEQGDGQHPHGPAAAPPRPARLVAARSLRGRSSAQRAPSPACSPAAPPTLARRSGGGRGGGAQVSPLGSGRRPQGGRGRATGDKILRSGRTSIPECEPAPSTPPPPLRPPFLPPAAAAAAAAPHTAPLGPAAGRITEWAELEGTHQDHQVQLLALHRTPQESHPVPESVV